MTHWGLEGTGKMEDGVAGDPRGPSTLLGYVHTIIYIAPKGTPEMVEWEHRFSSRKPPALTYTKEGKLLLIGGGYKVGARGIAE